MPNTNPSNDLWLANKIAQLQSDLNALKAQTTQYIVDQSGNIQAIVGNMSMDQHGNSTGLSGWGIATFANGSWLAQATGDLHGPVGAMTSQTRAVATTYQPNTTRPTLVIVTVALSVPAGNTYEMDVKMDAASPPTTVIAEAYLSNANAAGIVNRIPVTFLVPPAFYYRLDQASGSPTIQSTFEYTL